MTAFSAYLRVNAGQIILNVFHVSLSHVHSRSNNKQANESLYFLHTSQSS